VFGASAPPPPPAAIEVLAPAKPALVVPPWLFSPAPAEASARPPIRPSSALEGAEDFAVAASLSPRRAEALEEGRLLHRLLQFLPDLPASARAAAALRDLAAQGFSPERAEKRAADALRVLDDPRLAPLFGPDSVAEARIAARLDKPGGGFVNIAGAIDRLAETPDGVWLADYKTGAAQAETHVWQLALYRAAVALLYPGKSVRCFLIFTSGPLVEEIPGVKLDAALAEALKAG
jgi:ATP-dependent helicase/nuclease subunit A